MHRLYTLYRPTVSGKREQHCFVPNSYKFKYIVLIFGKLHREVLQNYYCGMLLLGIGGRDTEKVRL